MEEFFSPVKNHHSRKRKKILPSTWNSSHLIGMSTRSKSRIYTHQNRSGISRPDPIPNKPKTFLPESEPVEALSDVNCNNPSRISSIKDLRMRRVFTRDVNSVHQVEEEVEDETADMKNLLKGSDSSPVSISNVGDELEKSEVIVSKTEDPARNDFENGLNLKEHEISGNGSNSISKMALHRCRRRKVFKASSSFSYKRLLPYLMDIANDDSSVAKIEIVDAMIPCNLQKLDSVKSEMMSFAKCEGPQFDDTKMPFDQECVQMTPPNHDILTNTEVDHGGEPIEAENMLAEKQILKGSEKSNGEVSRQSRSSKHDTDPISRLILNPRSRVFDNPRSLSYRRLLPFLINVSQNNSCNSRITQHPMPRVDKEKDTVEKTENVSETKTENSYEIQLTEDGEQDYLPPSNDSSPETNNNLVSSTTLSSSTKYLSNGEPNLVTSEMPIDLHTEKMPQSDSDDRKFEPCPDTIQNRIEPPLSFIIDNDILKNQSTSVESGPVVKQKNCTDMGLELHSNNVDPIGRFDMNRNSLESEAMVSPANGSFRGILKRNRRGCRGLCNCLNCASFRLHADRAFEFSRNQMHDAEEVAWDLMKELANLRFLMEKSIVSDDDLAAIQLNTLHIKKACNKALEAENLAKGRLSQLNYDLNVHCRIPVLLEPKVTFAGYNQENGISVSGSFSSPEKKG